MSLTSLANALPNPLTAPPTPNASGDLFPISATLVNKSIPSTAYSAEPSALSLLASFAKPE